MAYATFNKPSSEIVLDLIYFANGVRFTKEEVLFGQLTSFEPLEIDPYQRNTKVDLTGQGRMSGSFTSTYRRLELEKQKPISDLPILVSDIPVNAHALLELVNYKYGLGLEPVDIIDDLFEDFTQPLSFRATPESLAWTGTLSVEITFYKLPLNHAIRKSTLEGFKPQEMASGGMNYLLVQGPRSSQIPEDALLLSLLPTNSEFITPTQAGWTLGTRILGETWDYSTTPSARNVYGAKVLYNGPIVPEWKPEGETDDTHVVVIQLSASCTYYSGVIVITYKGLAA